jgi:hypothetical protein
MVRSTQSNTRKSGVRRMTSAVMQPAISEVVSAALEGLSAKFVAARAKASPRTVEGWKQRKAIPRGDHVIAMLGDDELCARLLRQAGQRDKAHHVETIRALRAALGAVEGK